MAVNYLELFGTLCGIATVLLSAKQKIYTWYVSFVSIVLGFFVYWQVGLYGKCLLNLFYLSLHGYGWHQWLYGGKNKKPLQVTTTNFPTMGVLLAAGITGVLFLGYTLATYTSAALPYKDAFHTSFALIAEWMVAQKKIENWLVWIVLDLFYAGICFYKKLYLYGAEHLMYMGLGIYGFKAWRKSYAARV